MTGFLDERKLLFEYYEPSMVQNLNENELLLGLLPIQLNMMQFEERKLQILDKRFLVTTMTFSSILPFLKTNQLDYAQNLSE